MHVDHTKISLVFMKFNCQAGILFRTSSPSAVTDIAVLLLVFPSIRPQNVRA